VDSSLARTAGSRPARSREAVSAAASRIFSTHRTVAHLARATRRAVCRAGGSCRSRATVLRPLRVLPADFRIAPLTCWSTLAVSRVEHPHIAYLFPTSLPKRTWSVSPRPICIQFPDLDGVEAPPLEPVTGEGLDDWLRAVFDSSGVAGSASSASTTPLRRRGSESRLMNWSAELRAASALTPAAVAGPLLDYIDRVSPRRTRHCAREGL